MRDLLTKEEKELASRRGWGLFHTYDVAQRKWRVMALPLGKFNPKLPHVPHLINNLVAEAKCGDALALKALQLIAKGSL